MDYFVNDHGEFTKLLSMVISAIQEYCKQNAITFHTNKTQISNQFAQIYIEEQSTLLKVDFVNDIAAHYGQKIQHPKLGLIDSVCNILSNKITALSRYEPKDIADIWIIAKNYSFNWIKIFEDASEKELGVDSLITAEIISSFPADRLGFIKWTILPDFSKVKSELDIIVHDILSGTDNSLHISK